MKKNDMPSNPFQFFEVNDRSTIMAARSALATKCRRLKFTSHQTGKVEIIASEIMTNQLKYARGGMLLFRSFKSGGTGVIEILGLDKGPGMKDVRHYIKDGVSSGEGSLGTGMGAIERLSDDFDIYSYPGKGTVIYAQIRNRDEEIGAGVPVTEETKIVKARKEVDYGVLSVCYPGADVCGDAAASRVIGGNPYFLVSDGLGHGLPAHEASQLAVEVFKESEKKDICEMLHELHTGMQRSRGGVGAIVQIKLKQDIISYCGVGNISGRMMYGGHAKSMISVSGTLGYNMPRQPVTVDLPLERPAIIILHSDGVKNTWKWQEYPGLQSKHPLVIGSVLYRDCKVTRDDQIVLVIKLNKV